MVLEADLARQGVALPWNIVFRLEHRALVK